MNKKATLQLSMNFIVILVLAMLMFGVGMKFVTSIFLKADAMKESLDERTESQIMQTLDPGTPVSLPLNRYELERKETKTIGLGVLNELGSEATFYVEVYCDAAIDSNEDVLCDRKAGSTCGSSGEVNCDGWTYDIDEFTLDNNEKEIVSLFFLIPSDALSGDYIYNVQVCTGSSCSTSGSDYDTIKKLYITVPK